MSAGPVPTPGGPALSLEAEIPPDAAEALFRDGPLAARREGRGRGAAVALAWLDTEAGHLAAAGLALEAGRRGARRLLRILPEPDAPWRPATPPPTLATFGPEEAPEEAEGAALRPVARFTGTRTVQPLACGVEAVLLKGRLEAGADGLLAARLVLAGPPEATLEAMAALAEALPALPPRAALAEAGRALAAGEAPRPRRLGPPRLAEPAGVEAALAGAIGHLAEVMLWHAPAAAAGATPEGVHQTRVALRRLRSVLRVFRPACDGPALRDFDTGMKAVAAALGPARDWDVWLGGLGAEVAAALPEEPRIAALRAAAAARRDAAYAALRPVLAGPAFRALAWQAVGLAATRPWREAGGEDAAARREAPLAEFAAAVLRKRWKRLEEAGSDIGHLPDPEFHALRIEGKRLRYAAELFAGLWGRKRGRRFLKPLAEVQEAFGLANDAAVARGLVGPLAEGAGPDMAWAVGVAEGWALARARRARGRAEDAWRDLLEREIFWKQE